MICVRSVDLKPPKTVGFITSNIQPICNAVYGRCRWNRAGVVVLWWWNDAALLLPWALHSITYIVPTTTAQNVPSAFISFRAYTFRLTNFLQSFSTSYSLKTQAYGNPPDDCFTGHLTCSEIPWVEWAIYCVCTPLIILQNMHFLHYGKKLCAWQDKWSRRML